VIQCRCNVLNVMSGEVARAYLRTHLVRERTDGMNRRIHRCEVSAIEWIEDGREGGYGEDVLVLRRMQR
jgi:hypothetical protein